MVYGLVRDLCDQTELSVMRSKRIPMGNIIPVTQPNVLLARVNSGDVVWLVTVADFQSVTRFVELADRILRLGYNCVLSMNHILRWETESIGGCL